MIESKTYAEYRQYRHNVPSFTIQNPNVFVNKQFLINRSILSGELILRVLQ